MDSICEVTNRNFAQFIKSQDLCVLYFWADWYSSDGYMKYRMKHLSRMFPTVSFGAMDVDPEPHRGMVKCLGIDMVPTVIFFTRGSKGKCVEGSASLLTLSNAVQESMKTAHVRARLMDKYRSSIR